MKRLNLGSSVEHKVYYGIHLSLTKKFHLVSNAVFSDILLLLGHQACKNSLRQSPSYLQTFNDHWQAYIGKRPLKHFCVTR